MYVIFEMNLKMILLSWEKRGVFILRSGCCRFIYVFLCVGVIICFVFLIGYVVVELKNSFCFFCVFYIEVYYKIF